MSRREEFKARMKEFKLYKDTTGKGYWEWKLHSKVSSYALGGDNNEDGEEDDVFAQFIKDNPIQPGSVAPKDLVELGRMENLPYELNEYQKQFAKAWYTQRAKYSKYDSLLGNGKLGRILDTIDKSTYQTIPEFAETELKEYMRINNIDKSINDVDVSLKLKQLEDSNAMGFTRPEAYAWHVKPKTIKTPRVDYRGLGWHEGIGHIVGDNFIEIMKAAPEIWARNLVGDKEYEKYINKKNEQHASTWEFRGANAEMLDDNGKRYIDPNRQLTPSDVRRMIEKGATIPVEWRNSNLTESDIANFHNSFAYKDKPQNTFGFNVSNSANEVFFGKNGGEIPSYEKGGTNEDRLTSIVTNTVKKALERGDILLVLKVLRRGNLEDRKFKYPDGGNISTIFNIYDTPLLGDALSLYDAIKYSIKGDWDNASLSYLDAVSPLALFSKSKLNWKEWGAKKKYIPEYEAIEREAKKNGTWLKNADGTDFTGDPREWIVKRSKKFREAFGDKYLEGYTGMRNPYDPNLTTDTYLGSKDRAYTYTLNKSTVKKKGNTGVAKLVVPDTDAYTVDALGNDWLHLTDKSINPYNFTNTNQIVSNILTPVISFKNIRDDGPFGMRDIAEDQFVAKSTTPRKSVLYNNGDFDLSNPDIFRITAPSTGISPYLFMYGADRIRRRANRENTQSYAIGGETDNGNILGIEVPLWAETIASYIPVLGTAMDIKQAILNPSLCNIGAAALSAASDLAGVSIIRGLFKTTRGIDKLHKAEKALSKARKRYKLGETQNYSEIIKASDELESIKKLYDLKYGIDTVDGFINDVTRYAPIGLDFIVNTGQQLDKYGIDQRTNRQEALSYEEGGETENNTDDRTDHPISITQNLDKALSISDFTDRINHIDPNTGEYNPFYKASEDTYGTVPLSEVTITAPWTKLGRNNAAARRGMHYMQLGLEDAAKVAAPIVAGAALPAMASTGLLGKAVDLASVITDPLNPLNYLPYTKVLKTFGDFTHSSGNDTFIKFLYQNNLTNPKKALTDKFAPYKPEVILITDDIKDILNNTVFPRLQRNRSNIKKLGKDFDYGDIYEYDDIVFHKAGNPTEGFYNYENNAIVKKRNGRMSRLEVFSHELRHRADHIYPYTDYEKNITNRAFDGFLNALPENYDIRYDMTQEIPTTILDARNIVLSKFDKLFYKLPLDILDEFIRKAPNNLIEKAIETSNGYGRRFINYLYDNDLMSDERILAFREALIVGGLSTPIIINNNSN